MASDKKSDDLQNLPGCAVEFIRLVIKKMRYRRKVRRDVQRELAAHFEDELKGCASDKEREQKARQLISEFGDVKLLGVLLRRAKKRCRPLWLKALVRSSQVLGAIFLYVLICISPLIIGRPTIKVNYVDWLNEFVRAGRDEEDNARPYYEKAAELYIEMPAWMVSSYAKWPTDLNDTELKSLSSWLESNKDAFEMLRTATEERPYYWSRYQKSGEVGLVEALMPDLMKSLAGYRPVALAMREQIRYEAYSGDANNALRDCVVLVKYGDHLHGQGLLVEQLVGVAIEALGHSEIFQVSGKVDVPPEVLKSVQQKLQNQFRNEKPIICIDAEKAFWYDGIQRSFTDDGKGGGRVLIRGLPYAIEDSRSLWRLFTFSYPSRQKTVEQIEKYFEKAAELFEKMPRDLQNVGIALDNWNKDIHTNIMLKVQGPANSRVGQLGWRLKTSRAGSLTVLAIMRYQKEQGKYPDSLDELVEVNYLDDLPTDPYTDKPLVYKKTDDNFTLYSVGPNFKDDGGQSGKDDKGRVKKWADNGDTVFWPVPDLSQ
ncbi:MAG: hypothetical protein MUO70_01875 [Euryarchaeota archaeon]|nr:hypothetical protein [Euryarchaeota archaeon]